MESSSTSGSEDDGSLSPRSQAALEAQISQLSHRYEALLNKVEGQERENAERDYRIEGAVDELETRLSLALEEASKGRSTADHRSERWTHSPQRRGGDGQRSRPHGGRSGDDAGRGRDSRGRRGGSSRGAGAPDDETASFYYAYTYTYSYEDDSAGGPRGRRSTRSSRRGGRYGSDYVVASDYNNNSGDGGRRSSGQRSRPRRSNRPKSRPSKVSVCS